MQRADKLEFEKGLSFKNRYRNADFDQYKEFQLSIDNDLHADRAKNHEIDLFVFVVSLCREDNKPCKSTLRMQSPRHTDRVRQAFVVKRKLE